MVKKWDSIALVFPLEFRDFFTFITICYVFNAPGAYMTKLTPPHQTPPGASKNGSQRVSLGTFVQSENGVSKLQGGVFPNFLV